MTLSTKKTFERLDIHPNTLRRWIKEDRVRAVRTLKGRFRVPEEEGSLQALRGDVRSAKILGYARVSSTTQKDDLHR